MGKVHKERRRLGAAHHLGLLAVLQLTTRGLVQGLSRCIERLSVATKELQKPQFHGLSCTVHEHFHGRSSSWRTCGGAMTAPFGPAGGAAIWVLHLFRWDFRVRAIRMRRCGSHDKLYRAGGNDRTDLLFATIFKKLV
uniref:RxLR effector candidate protein n=1 Tax=Hyaloperonospora arabidopsidis (strain Emoy2) TaxID=559515 RepID=M4BTQ6_HYAAE